ncbi:MAG: methylated-DNA--[protein]-cysteine S-methyltransferase [Acutalibacteraceae bacterium]|nr:methylated-DNA--[protein]-cysteine S-methyltransferase [Acutalibacteraceae bacterium]HIR04078.1 methylated-DNA--[protein]-cysteine S-methyltransferase [Candidatus Scatovicinus merdipullorum]
MYYSMRYLSPLGPLVVVSDGKHIVGLWMEGQKYFSDTIKETPTEKESLPALQAAKNWLDRYFSGQKPESGELLLAPAGGDFRQEVWDILRSIPYGRVTTYGQIAKAIAKKRRIKSMSAQAVGGAVGRNPISIMIPCHRVIGANGSLTGYAGGLSKKKKLLELENADMSCLFIPDKTASL